MLSGLIPSDGSDQEELKRRLLAGRYVEIRMLFFLGKDVLRWIDQCIEWADRIPTLNEAEVRGQSFAGLLTANAPEPVKEKLTRWLSSAARTMCSRPVERLMPVSMPRAPESQCGAPNPTNAGTK